MIRYLKDEVSTSVFGLQGAIQTFKASETKEFDGKRRLFENDIQTAWKESEAHCARLTKPP